mgnify:CR=1 FL=1
MKLLLFCEALRNRAGIERMTVELANLLCIDYNVTIVTIDSFDEKASPYKISRKVRVRSMNSSFHKTFSSLKCLNIRNVLSFRRICREEAPEVVITVATPLVRITAPAIIGLGIKNIGWEHFTLFAGSKVGAIFKIIASWCVDKTIVLTDADAADYRGEKALNITVIPNFTSIGNNPPSLIENKILLAVGRHSKQKGFDLLLKAWAKSKPQGWLLIIVGDGDLKNDNIKLAVDLGIANSVVFKPTTPDIADEFHNASCFVLSSRYEGLVLALIEAKMMGLPSICFDCPNSPREVIRDGIDGWLVPPEDVDALAKEIKLRLTDLRNLKAIGIEARNDALNRYSQQAIYAKWQTVLTEITG